MMVSRLIEYAVTAAAAAVASPSQAAIGLTRVLDNRVQTGVSTTPTVDKSTKLWS